MVKREVAIIDITGKVLVEYCRNFIERDNPIEFIDYEEYLFFKRANYNSIRLLRVRLWEDLIQNGLINQVLSELDYRANGIGIDSNNYLELRNQLYFSSIVLVENGEVIDFKKKYILKYKKK